MNKIKELRTERNLTQKQLADILGINQTAVGKYERDELEPNIQMLIKIANFFEYSIDYIVGRSDDFGNVSIQKNFAEELTAEEMEIIETFRAQSPKNKELFLLFTRNAQSTAQRAVRNNGSRGA